MTPKPGATLIVSPAIAATRPTNDRAHRFRRFAKTAKRTRHRYAVPAFDDALSRRSEAQDRAPAGELVERHRGHREQRGRAAVDVDDAGAEADALGHAREGAKRHEGIAAPRLRHEHGLVAGVLGRARERGDLRERPVVDGPERDPYPRHRPAC